MMHLVRTEPSSKALLIKQLHTEIATLRIIREEMREELRASEEPQPELEEQIRRTTAAMEERYKEVWHLKGRKPARWRYSCETLNIG